MLSWLIRMAGRVSSGILQEVCNAHVCQSYHDPQIFLLLKSVILFAWPTNECFREHQWFSARRFLV